MEIIEIRNEKCPKEKYLERYGFHFSKKMYEWAISEMRNKNGNINAYTKEEVSNLLRNNNIVLENNKEWDAIYVANMCKADFLGSSIPDESHLVKYVKDVIDDSDGYCGMVFCRFCADCMGSGKIIDWENMI